MILRYEGTDITGDVEIDRCVYESRESGAVPWLSLEFADDAGLWDRWSPQPGERVEVSEAGASGTGAMYVDKVEPYSGGYAIHATALPVADARAVREWRDTTLTAVAGQLAATLGMALAVHGVDDMSIAYARQDDEESFGVLTRLAAVAGCTLDLFDGTLHLCGREWAESRDAVGTISLDEGSEYSYSRRPRFASCSVRQPESDGARGMYAESGEGEPRLALELDGTLALPGTAELARACAGLMAHENARMHGGYAKASSASPYTPGSVCVIDCEGAPSMSGLAMVTRVRNDYAYGTSKTWWRSI